MRADKTGCPAGEFLDALKTGMWEPDPDAEELPDDEQISDWHWFLNAIRHWASTGEPVHPGAVNDLDDGVWEFKRAKKRLSFYDTDGAGGYTPKLRILDHRDAEAPNSDYWQIPYFDHWIRLGHAFPKVTQATPEYDLEQTTDVREEDLAHDRTTA
ncbi:hypothetical protein A5659_03620 [Mycobacterium sp. 1165196.3]|nr:hypothetical protein A5659_03620 [Mycobacterium sp. 1165196.3]